MLNKKQRGATLFTSLVFLALMTIVSVTAAKIASLDALVSGNNQQQMLVFQQTEKTLKGFTNPLIVTQTIAINNGVNSDWEYTLDANPNDPSTINATRDVKNRGIDYPCKTNGMANAVGSDTAPSCYMFDLSAEDTLGQTGIRDKHFRGVGRALPNTSNYN